jgi:hypothetical protein
MASMLKPSTHTRTTEFFVYHPPLFLMPASRSLSILGSARDLRRLAGFAISTSRYEVVVPVCAILSVVSFSLVTLPSSSLVTERMFLVDLLRSSVVDNSFL